MEDDTKAFGIIAVILYSFLGIVAYFMITNATYSEEACKPRPKPVGLTYEQCVERLEETSIIQ